MVQVVTLKAHWVAHVGAFEVVCLCLEGGLNLMTTMGGMRVGFVDFSLVQGAVEGEGAVVDPTTEGPASLEDQPIDHPTELAAAVIKLLTFLLAKVVLVAATPEVGPIVGMALVAVDPVMLILAVEALTKACLVVVVPTEVDPAVVAPMERVPIEALRAVGGSLVRVLELRLGWVL